MSRHISSVLDINMGIKKSWTVLVQVVENGHVQKSNAGNDFKRLVLTDSQGTMLNALIFSSHLRYFASLLIPYRRYYISNAVLTKNDPRYRIGTYQYSWSLNNRTLVEEHVDSIPMTLPCHFEFTSFNELPKYADSDSLRNVRAVVLHCFPSSEHGSDGTTKRDVVIVNEEKKLLLLTLWNHFDQKDGMTLDNLIQSGPLIFGMRLKVTTFNSLSLTTRAFSGLMINPPVAEDLQMKDWYNDNKAELKQLLENKSYKNSDLLLPYPKEEDIISVAIAAASLTTLKTAWVKGKTKLPRQERSCWYTTCANCQKSLEADADWVVTCPSCRMETEVDVVSRVTVMIDDGSATIRATLCSPDAEKIMPYTAVQLKEADENGIDLHADIAESVQQHTIVAFIRSYETTFHGQTHLNINVVKAYKPEESLTLPNLISLPTSGHTSETTLDVLTQAESGKVKEVFSPSTPSKPTKRSLAFSQDEPGCKTISAPATPAQGTLLAIKKEVGLGKKATHESPTKKTKESSG